NIASRAETGLAERIILGRVGIGRNGDLWRADGLVHHSDRPLPGSKYGVRRDGRAAELPVVGAAVGSQGDVRDEERGPNRTLGQVGACLIAGQCNRANLWIESAV